MTSPEAGPVDDGERVARMLFSRVCEPGDVDAAAMISQYGARAVLDRLLDRRPVTGKVEGWAIRLAATSADEVCAAGAAVNARYVCPGDLDWPLQLDDLRAVELPGAPRRASVPFGLWVRGAHTLALAEQSVSIVGSRASSAYGDHVAGDLAYHCGARGWTTVSGGAYGIDAAAHRGALAGQRPTIAVLAGGIDRLYPAGNTRMLRSIEDNGVLVAEAAPGCKPIKSRFLVRNRLIAALSRGTIVVEAAIRSGALSSARWALDLGRPVMGVPGPVTSRASSGVHELLRQPGPLLVTDVDEVLEHCSSIGRYLAPRKIDPDRRIDRLGPVQQAVLEALPIASTADVGDLSIAAGVGAAAVSTALEELLELGMVAGDATGWRLNVAGLG